ncbi:MAG: HAMP domain-containing sensor histidine kinase [Acidimicrobiales bacterium]
MSLRTRLLLAVGIASLVALLAADIVTYTQLRSFLYGRVDQDLQSGARQYVQLAQGGGGGLFPQGGPQPGGPMPNGVSQYEEVVSPSGQVVQQISRPYYGEQKYTPDLPDHISGFTTGTDGSQVVYLTVNATEASGPAFRVRVEIVASGQYAGDYLVVAEPVNDVIATLNTLQLVELIVSLCALAVAAALGLLLVQRGLRPLIAMERTAESIADGELDERVPVSNDKTEVGRLATTLNVMLSRIQQAFAQRDATEAELRSSEERLRRFVGDASHELRTPLAAVSAYAELFERGASSRPEDLSRVLQGIRAETARMGRLVEDLLLLARLDEGIPLKKEPIELVALVSDAIRTAAAVGPDWPTTLVATHPVEVPADGPRLRQVIDNLLSNVRSHTPRGTTTTVTVSEDGSGSAVIEVADTGDGLTGEQARKVFERFYRTDRSRSRESGGAGLGLSIAASIVSAHGGSVSAAPRPGRGAVFTVRIPSDPVRPAPLAV